MSDREFKLGDKLRYKPGTGTYGYDDMLEADGRMPAVVVGFSRTRVRVLLSSSRTRRQVQRSVDAESLTRLQ